MTALNVLHDSLDSLPESIDPRDLYTEKDGKFILTGVAGLKTQSDVDAIKQYLQDERNAHKETKTKYRDFADMDAEDVQAKLGRLAELEVLTKGQQEDFDSKLEGLTEARVKSRLSPVERELKNIKDAMAEREQELAALRSEKVERTILDSLRVSAVDSKLPNESMADAELLAQNLFTIDEATGKPVTRENSLGFTEGIEADVFMQELREKRAHWWPESRGGNAQGSSGGGGGFPDNPFSGKHWNLTKQGQVIRDLGREKSEQMAKAAGTYVGGPRPESK